MKKIIFLGDSITEGFDLKLYFPNLDIVNKGIYGDNTDGVLSRINKDAVELNPDIVFLLIGTNDFACGKTNTMLIDNLKKILTLLKNNIPAAAVYHASILPVRGLDNRNNTDIQEVNKEMESFCISEGIIYFNLYPHFLNAGLELAEKYSEDGLHLTKEGYNKWAELLAPVVEQ
jgi:lysophospholipase L1-like esterase